MKTLFTLVLFSLSTNLWAMGALFEYANPKMEASTFTEQACFGSEVISDPRIDTDDHR